jgi:hypothetical protein
LYLLGTDEYLQLFPAVHQSIASASCHLRNSAHTAFVTHSLVWIVMSITALPCFQHDAGIQQNADSHAQIGDATGSLFLALHGHAAKTRFLVDFWLTLAFITWPV